MVEIVRRGARIPRDLPRVTGSRPAIASHASNGPALSLGTGLANGPSIGAGLPHGPWLSDGIGLTDATGTPPARPSRWLSRPLTSILLDALAVSLALILANQVVARGAVIALPGDAGLTYPQLSVPLGTGWLAALATCRRAVRLPRGYWRTECRYIARAAFIVLGAVCMAAVVLPLDIDRPFMAVTFAAGLLLQLVSRWLIRRAALRRRDDRARTAGPHLGSEARSADVHE